MKALHNALYVKSFDDFLENTKPQNIKKTVFYGYSLALSRPMLTEIAAL